MNPALLERIKPVATRMRSQRFWRVVSIIAILAACYALIAQHFDGIRGIDLAVSVASGFVIATAATWLLCRFSFRNPRFVASRIEQRFPSLEQRLLTAVGQSEDKLGFLQRRVIKEARDHSYTNRWTETIPTSQLFWSRLLGICSVAFLGFSLGTAAINPSDIDTTTDQQNSLAFDIGVEPGNAEIERGTSLVVTARFNHPNSGSDDHVNVPETAKLFLFNDDGKQRTITMTRNLSDPVVGGFVSSVNEKFHYKVVTPTWESETFTIDVFDFPALVRSDASLQYPEYTGLESKRIEDTVRISAIEGTQVTWFCFLNKDVAKAELVAEDGRRIALSGDSNDAMTASFQLQATQRFTLELTDDSGRRNKFPPELIARLLPNMPPELKLTSFGDTSVSPLEELPLEAEVQDDVGISRVGLTYTIDGLSPNEVILKRNLPRGAKSSLQHLVELEKLDAEPDQLFSYHFWAEDFGPDGNLRRTQSDMFFAEVRPFDQIFREGQPPPGGNTPPPSSQTGQQAQELAELQKEIINATWRVIREEVGEEPTEEFAKNADLLVESQATALRMLDELAQKVRDEKSRSFIDAVREKMQQAFAELQKSKQQTTTDPLSPAIQYEQAAYAGLLKLRAREFQVSQSSQSPGQPGSASQQQLQKQLNELELDQDLNRYESERKAQESSKEEQAQRETRQILSRLRDLARRQQDLNKEIAELQNALEQAKTEQEREEVERRLKRLREQQQELLRETDELSERMQQPENQQNMREANEQLQETRDNVQKASDALEQKDTSQALNAGRRAERQFEEMRDKFRREASGQFDDAVKQMRHDAQELDQKEEQLAEQLNELNDPKQTAGLRGDDRSDELQEQLEKQRERLKSLQQEMQKTVEEAEAAEPLLAQNLYDSFRRTQQQQIDRQLRNTKELLRRGFDPQAQEMERGAREQIDQLREDLEEAATAVLGDETKALQRALAELEQLERELSEEIDSNQQQVQQGDTPSEPQTREGEAPAELQTREGDAPAEPQTREGDAPAEPGDQPGKAPDEPNSGSAGASPSRRDQADSGSAGASPSRRDEVNSGSAGASPSRRDQANGGSGGSSSSREEQPRRGGRLDQIADSRRQAAPLGGDDFREWSDRLRDVEEMVDDPELQNRAAAIRDRAREVRRDLRRNNQAPQWDLVEQMIAVPLRELKQQVSEELFRRSAERNAPVPIDRDPVPSQYSDAVERYYESLGGGR